MSERTPGPWHVNKFMDEDDSYSIDDDTGQVAKTYCEGNAKLIAAAPELLEALRPFAKFACSGPCDCMNCRARDVITKATA